MRSSIRRYAGLLALALVLPVVAGTTVGASPFAASRGVSTVQPQRILDTRSGIGAAAGKVRPGGVLRFDAGAARAAGATSVILNLTATQADGPGWAKAWPCEDPEPATSSLNFVPGQDIANAVVVKLTRGGICLSTYAPVHLVGDLSGWFSDARDFVGTTPNRIVDTRVTGDPLRAQQERSIRVAGTSNIPGNATMAALNLTIDKPSKPGWVVVYPCGSPTSGSTVNFAAGDTVANLTVVGLSNGSVCLRSLVDAQIVIDSSGWSAGGGTLLSQTPQRVLDTRDSGSWWPGSAQNNQTLSLRVAGRGGVPNDAAAALLTVTVTNATGFGFVTLWACDQPKPTTSTINTFPGVLRSNMAVVALAPDGTVCLQQYTSNGTELDIVVDAIGYTSGGPARTPPTSNGSASPMPGAAGGGSASTGANILGGLGIPRSSASEPTGNFRTICSFSHFAYDDPIVAPGQPGASHLHMFFGNTGTNAASTYESLRSSGDGSCEGGALNRSGYWTPAVSNAAGNPLIPDHVAVYYKGNGPSAALIKTIRPFPAGLKMIAGYDMNVRGDQSASSHFSWTCENTQNPAQTIPNCPAGERVGVRLQFPNCWDGVNLDAADHRSHMAYGTWQGTGEWHCPAGHPVLLPEYSIGVWFANDGNSANWYLASDRMAGMATTPNGSSFHADWFGAWDPTVEQTFVTTCINGLLDCQDGQLGNGTKLVGGRTYTGPRVVAPVGRPG